MLEPFFKYHGLGNDFVVLDRRASGLDIDAEVARELCDRRRGIGADGVLVLLPPDSPGAVARMVVHNADGSVAEMCGNGLRCVVKHAVERLPERPPSVVVDTGAGALTASLQYRGAEVVEVTVSMGPARLLAAHLPTGPDHGPFVDQPIAGVRGTAVSMGNPHLVLFDTDPSRAAQLGPLLEVDPHFPERANVEFCRLEADGRITLTVWERGVGITQACGTGACAAVVAAAILGRRPFDQWVEVDLPGGALQIRVAKDLGEVHLRGPVQFVFEGALPS